MKIGGVQKGYWQWTYGAAFPDLSGNGNTMTPSFRTAASSAYLSALLTSFRPIDTAIPPAYAVSDPGQFYSTTNITTSSNFTSASIPATGGPPGAAVIEEPAAAGGTPLPWMWGIIAMVTIVPANFFWDWMSKRYAWRSMWPKAITGGVIIGLLITFGKFDFWMMIMYIMLIASLMVASRHQDTSGSMSQHGLIGFLAQSWIGLTIISRIMEGQLITSAEAGWANHFAFLQDFNVFGIIHIPVINFEFFSKGIPMLLKWDYSTIFTGNAQMIEYLLYSLTAVMCFIIFSIIVGMAFNAFSSVFR